MDWCIAIATRNRPLELARTLTTLPPEVPVWICDQSPEPSVDPRARILHRPRCRGLPEARNLLLAAIPEHEWILFIDDDVDLAADFGPRLGELCNADPGVVAWGPVVESRPLGLRRLHRLSQLGALRDPRRLTPGPIDAPTRALFGCCFAVRHAAARATAFDAGRRGYALGEDFDFFLRLPGRKRFARALRCRHREAGGGRADPERRGRAKAAMLKWLARRHGAHNPTTLLHLILALAAAALAGARAREAASWRGLIAGLRQDPLT